MFRVGRALGIAGFVVALALSVYLFEWQHVGPFNADRVGLLRALFYTSAAGAVLALVFSGYRWLPPLLLGAGFALATGLSRAQLDARHLAITGIFLVGLWLSVIVVRPPLTRLGH
jgi:hypothetical protein